MNQEKDELVQLIVGKNEQWKNYDYISVTNGLDNAEYRRRLEKLIQYPQSARVHGYVETIMGETGTITDQSTISLNLVGLKDFYLNAILTNHTEMYLRDVMLLAGIELRDAKLVQFSKNVYTISSDTLRTTDLTPVVHLSNISNYSLEEPVIDTEKLNHLVSDNPVETIPSPTDLPDTPEKLIHLTSEDIQQEQTELITAVDKAIAEQKSIDNILQPVYQQPKETLYEPKSVDTTPVENIEIPQTKVDIDNEKTIQTIKEKKLTDRLREKILSSSVSDPAKTGTPGGRVLQPLDHWRGNMIKDLKTYHESSLIEYRNGEWVTVKESDPIQGPRRRQYDYDAESIDPEYQYLNSAESAARTITGDNGNKGDYEPPHRGTVEDLFDHNDNAYLENKDEGRVQSDGQKKFQGSHTPIYLEHERDKRQITEQPDGLLKIEKERYNLKNFNKNPDDLTDTVPERPLSALDPFTRVSTRGLDLMHIPQHANAFSYNRTRIPIAEVEWRKGFRYLFITRPECYIMTTGNVLSSQCMNDETFYTSWCRLPHISYLLSPSYITCVDKTNWTYRDNFNYLLTNRVMNMSTIGTEMDQLQSIQKATTGASITPGTTINNDYGGNLSLTFRDTKDLEVYECLRLWMRYIHKIYNGTFASSFNHYSYYNTYGDLVVSDTEGVGSNNDYGTMNKIHPYDRALDYCATIFDIVTNESGTKIVYWCKYIGVYPMSATQTGLTDNLNKALDNEQTVQARFYYQGREEYKMKSLVEFNYNAGILDSLGHPSDVTNLVVSHPYLVRQSTNPDQMGYVSPRSMKMDYIGASGLFTGRPYCVLRKGQNRLMPNGLVRSTITPQLRFMSLQNETLNRYMNGDIVNDENNTDPNIIRIT